MSAMQAQSVSDVEGLSGVTWRSPASDNGKIYDAINGQAEREYHVTRNIILTALLLFTSLTSPVLADQTSNPYAVTKIVGPASWSSVTARGINEKGQVVGSFLAGYSQCSCWMNGLGYTHAFVWSDGKMTDLGMPPNVCAFSSIGYGINDQGQVVGTTSFPDGWCPSYAFIYTNGSMSLINGGLTGSLTSINKAGQAVGSLGSGPGGLYDSNKSTIVPLGSLGGTGTMGWGINDAGAVVGQSALSDNTTNHAFLLTAGPLKDFWTLGGTNSAALGISNTGMIVGWADTATGARHAFLSPENAVLTDLGTLGGTNSQADGVNNNGQVVGWANTASGDQHAFLYSNGSMVDLNLFTNLDAGEVLVEATGINNLGQIVANGNAGNAYLLSPRCTPPSSIFSDDTGTGGFAVTTTSSPRLDLDRRESDVRVQNYVRLWMGVNILPSQCAQITPNLAAGVEGATAALNLNSEIGKRLGLKHLLGV